MRRPGLFFLAFLLFGPAAWCASPYPPARADDVVDVFHGVRVPDPYRWLENQDSPETRAWIEAERRYTEEFLARVPGRDALKDKIASALRIDTIGRPLERRGRYFFTRRRAGEDRASICMRAGYTGPDLVLVEPASVAPDPASAPVLLDASKDGSLLVYGIRRGGEDETDIRILDVATRKLLPDGLPRGRYFSFDLQPDNRGYYYSRFRDGVGSRVYYHAMGGQASAERELFGEGYGPTQLIESQLSDDGRYLAVAVAFGVPPRKVDVYVQDLAAGGSFRPIVQGIDAEFRPFLRGRRLLLWTNWKAPNWRVLAVDLQHPEPARWKEIIPEGPQVIGGLSLAGGRIFAGYIENVHSRIRQFDLAGKDLGDLALPALGQASEPEALWDSRELFYTFTSFTTPGTVYRYNVATGRQDVWFRPRMPIKTDDLEAKQVWYESKDHTRVPMFVVHRRGIPLDGRRPTLLYGYGGFAVSLLPAFRPLVAVWTEMGGVYAVPNLRGGGEFGESWHRAGMFEKKQNVFDDFLAAAEWLVHNGYTNPARLAIQGASNGGLLVGAALTQRPELFKAVICGAPVLDMLRFDKMKVGAWWAAEYGSASDPKQFEYLYRYSPYQRVRKGVAYPAVLFVTGDSDTRVDPAHARKMAALLQASSSSPNPILLRYDVSGGHSGQGSVDKVIDEGADELAFLAAELLNQ